MKHCAKMCYKADCMRHIWFIFSLFKRLKNESDIKMNATYDKSCLPPLVSWKWTGNSLPTISFKSRDFLM